MSGQKDQKALTKRSDDSAKWYSEVVQRAELADYSPVRGCMVIRPYGYAIWENIQNILGQAIKDAGVQNAYFPLFIPYSFLEREADHVEGFAPEVALVTHAGGKELEEKLAVRPTSETVIYEMFSKWVESYRDLPLKVNQWANVVRWEKRTNPFLRTTEFLWQEGHTLHASKEQAATEVLRALDMYYQFVSDVLAMHVIKGYKTEKEKFAGAEYTTTIEGLMKDGKALQSGTSHLLGQGFTKSFDVDYTDENGEQQYAWATSWGLSTRIIGGLILQHGDDKGLVLPPAIAPVQVIIVPIYKSENEQEVLAYATKVKEELVDAGFTTEMDTSDNSPGWKFSQAEMRGIPLRIEIGPKDIEKDALICVSRDNGEKESVERDNIVDSTETLLEGIQTRLYSQAQNFTEERTVSVENYEEFLETAPQHNGFIAAYFAGDRDDEKKIQEATKFTTRCIPLSTYELSGKCIATGQPGKLTLFAKAY